MNHQKNINAPKVNAIIPQGVTDKPFTGGAFKFYPMIKEEWKQIKDFPDYLISNFGNIISKKSAEDKPMRNLCPSDNGHGYKRIALWKNGKGYYKRIARLVADAFIPNPENKSEVNHKDCNKVNDYYLNLEWCTHKEHEKHTTSNGLHPTGIKTGGHKLTEKQVSHIRYIYNRYHSMGFIKQRELAKEFGVCQSTIGYIVRNETWKNI